MFASVKAVFCIWRTGTVKVLLGDQHWVPVKAMETCHGLRSPGLGSCFPIVCPSRVKPCLRKGNGKTPTDCDERDVWPLVSNKGSVKPGGGSSLQLLQGWCAPLRLAHSPPLRACSSSEIYRALWKSPHIVPHGILNHWWTFNHSGSQIRRKQPCCHYINQRNY